MSYIAHMASPRIFVALGSNLGNRLLNLAEAQRRLAALPKVAVRSDASVIETDALTAADDPWPQPPYLNTVLELVSQLSPLELLEALLDIERAMGRRRTTRWAPRVIDLDLILYGDRIVDEPGLHVPHPGLTHRPFVLRPLAAIAPEVRVPPHGHTVADLLRRL